VKAAVIESAAHLDEGLAHAQPGRASERRTPFLGSLEDIARVRGASSIEDRIAELRGFLSEDLAAVEEALGALDVRDTPLHDSAEHLVSAGGKRLRPLCVALAARIGRGFDERVRDLAVAAELVHSATLLHDDVVDLGDKRRGRDAARVIYGNAASIFAGDWLLVEALRRVQRAGMPDVLDGALRVLGEMLEAEALQLARRGRVNGSRDDYLAVVRGKTASLFRWAMFAGGRAGGLASSEIEALERFGELVGTAFQIVDDTLDVDGDESSLGKGLFADLREGKLTFPLIVALEREPRLRGELEVAIGVEGEITDVAVIRRAVRVIRETGANVAAKAWASELVASARAAPGPVTEGPARRALEGVAESIVTRSK
jgi:octaprenyl-diphosphate synthase